MNIRKAPRSLRLCAMVCAVFAGALSGCTGDPSGTAPQAPSTTASAARFTIGGVRLGDSLERVKSLKPAPNCYEDSEADSDDPDDPLLCETTFTYGAQHVRFYVAVAKGHVRAIHNTDLAEADVKAVATALRSTFGASSASEVDGTVHRETWTTGNESVLVTLDSQYAGGGVVLSSDEVAESASTAAPVTPVASEESACEGAPITIKGICIGMPVELAVERAKLFVVTDQQVAQGPGRKRGSIAHFVGAVTIESADSRVTRLVIGGPAIEDAFGAADMPLQEFAQAIADSYRIPELTVDSVTADKLGRQRFETATLVHRYAEGVAVFVSGNTLGNKSVMLDSITPASKRKFD